MKVYSFLDGIPFEQLSDDEIRTFSIEAQVKMLRVIGYEPIFKTQKSKNNTKGK